MSSKTSKTSKTSKNESREMYAVFVRGTMPDSATLNALAAAGAFYVAPLRPHVGKRGGIGKTLNVKDEQTSIGKMNISAAVYVSGSTGAEFDDERAAIVGQSAALPKNNGQSVEDTRKSIAQLLG